MNIEKIVAKNVYLLRRKGYLDNSLSASNADAFAKDLRQKIDQATRSATIDNPTNWFQIEMKGKLYEQNDLTYQFNYCFDLRLKDVLFSSAVVHHNDAWKVAVCRRPEDCLTNNQLKELVRPKIMRRKQPVIKENSSKKGIKI